MAATAIIARSRTTIDTIEVDATMSELHTASNVVTDHPVEQGSNVSDHSRPEPDGLQLDCIVSNSPLPRGAQTRQITQDTDAGSFDFSVPDEQTTPGRARNVYDQLLKLRNTGALVKVVTALRTYGGTEKEGMEIVNLSVPRDSKTAGGLRFSITFKQVRIVRNKLTKFVKSASPQAQPKQKKGNETPFVGPPVRKQTVLRKAQLGTNDVINKGVDYIKSVGN